jgi:predicted transcriptional regulator of viral defense system
MFRFLAQHAQIAALASAQHAVFGLDQLERLGLTARAIQQRTSTARLHRVHHAVYSLVPPKLLTRRGRYMAAVLACGRGAALSHRSAGDLLRVRATSRPRVDVIVPGRSHRKHEGIDLHRSTTLTEADVTTVDKIPCTTVARTLLDLADALPRRALERAFDQAEVMQLFDLRALEDQLGRNAKRCAAAKVQDVLATHYIGRTQTWSELEEAFLSMIRAANIPAPEVNAWIVLPDGETPIRGDFVWREQRLVVETDGHGTHGTRQQFEQDRRRDQRLAAAGWRVIRITWRQLVREPVRLAQTLEVLLMRSPPAATG